MVSGTRKWRYVILLCWMLVVSAHCVFGQSEGDREAAATQDEPRPTARTGREARVPIYYWGPPRDDYVMNVGNQTYQAFMVEHYAPEMVKSFDGLYFDTVPPDVPGPARSASILEYPRRGAEAAILVSP